MLPIDPLKQGSRTHSVLCQRGSQLQKYKAARMSRRIPVEFIQIAWIILLFVQSIKFRCCWFCIIKKIPLNYANVLLILLFKHSTFFKSNDRIGILFF